MGVVDHHTSLSLFLRSNENCLNQAHKGLKKRSCKKTRKDSTKWKERKKQRLLQEDMYGGCAEEEEEEDGCSSTGSSAAMAICLYGDGHWRKEREKHFAREKYRRRGDICLRAASKDNNSGQSFFFCFLLSSFFFTTAAREWKLGFSGSGKKGA